MKPEQRRQRLLEYLASGLIVGHRLCVLLGISERTLFRDVALLRKRGHVIHANPGPGGGLWLGDEGKLLPFHLSITDVRELAYALARSASQALNASKSTFVSLRKAVHLSRLPPRTREWSQPLRA